MPILLARTSDQASAIEAQGFGAMLWRGETLDGRQLIAGADAVVSAGGSMNREAAVLGAPAWSVYAGKLGAVDRTLVADGRLRLLSDEAGIEALVLGKKHDVRPTPLGVGLVRQFVDRILAVTGA